MELRDFAERVLFATTLGDKLRGPDDDRITDREPGPARAAPPQPGRPRGLDFKPAGDAERDPVPGATRLTDPGHRARLLHRFANHELLAAELMALVLLRFPQAPAGFRRGVYRTLREEQQHTRWYAERLAAAGVGFGDLPVSGYFWRAVSGMASPLDYVAGLSLTFEQANLDFARHFAREFAAAGDQPTAELLERIQRDEIGHVAHGLRWLRRWKEPGQSDWEAYQARLRFPLSPRRARGLGWNPEARRAAGLDEAFIAAIAIQGQSKGRTPTVRVFNPFEEARIAEGPRFQPAPAQAALERDLALLPAHCAREGDVVLVDRPPRAAFLAGLAQAGVVLPEFVERTPPALAALGRRKLGALAPWAWGPGSVELFQPLAGALPAGARPPDQCFTPGRARLYAKGWSAGFLQRFLAELAGKEPAWLCPPEVVGVEVANPEAAWAAVAAIRAGGHHPVVLKASLGLAGHNAVRLWEPEILPAQRRWLEARLGEGRTVVVEPWLDRVAEFSVQAELREGRLRRIGYAGLETDRRGQFRANRAEPGWERRPPSAVRHALAGTGAERGGLEPLYERLLDRLGAALPEAGLAGPVGIDAFVYRDATGRCRLKPVVEINPRYTMGRLLLEWMARVGPGKAAEFRLVPRSSLPALGASGFVELAARWAEEDPVVRAGEPVPRIARGTVCLNDPAQAEAWLAVVRVGDPSGPGP